MMKEENLKKSFEPLSELFYSRNALTLAKEVLGKYIIRNYNNELLIVRIVETEAYHEIGDPACHAFNGKTERNSVMFESPGMLYVYFTYGMHYCMNLVAEPAGTAAAVLIRAAEPVCGISTMKKLRTKKSKQGSAKTLFDEDIASGPAKLCQGLAITNQQNGANVKDFSKSEIYLAQKINAPKILISEIIETTRVGIKKGTELPWRFYLKDSICVSRI